MFRGGINFVLEGYLFLGGGINFFLGVSFILEVWSLF